MSLDSTDFKPVTVELFEKYSYSQKLLFAFDINKIKKDEKAADQSPKKKQPLLLDRQSDALSFNDHAMFYAFVYRKRHSGELDEQRKKLLLKLSQRIIAEQRIFAKHLLKEELPKQFEVKEEVLKYANEVLEFEWMKVLNYPRYYTVRDVLPLLCAAETTKPVFFHMLTPLEMGRLPYLIVPTKTAKTLRINQNYPKLFQRFPTKPTPNHSSVLYKTPIKDDANARKLALKFGASTLLTSGCLQVLFATTDSCLGTSWEIPIVVEEVADGEDKTRKLIFIEKPFKQRNMPLLERNLLFYKRSLKLGVTHPKHHKSHKLHSPLPKKQCFTKSLQKVQFVKKSDTKDDGNVQTSGEPDYSRTNDNVMYDLMDDIELKEDFGDSDSDSDGLVIDLDEKQNDSMSDDLESGSDYELVIDLGEDANESFSSLETNESKSDAPDNASVSGRTSSNSNTEIPDALSVDAEVNNLSSGSKAGPTLRRSTRLNKQNTPKESPETSLETIDELQNETLGGTAEVDSSLLTENKKECENDIKLEDFIPPKEGHNVRYELWRIGEVNVLVRCTVDGVTYNNDQKAVLNKVVPKMEYKSNYGGECTTAIECAKQWISTTIIPNSKLLRVRIDAFTSMVVGAQYLDANQVVPPKVEFNPYNYISNLSSILGKLSLLPVGCYIMSHSAGEGVFKIMQEVETETAEPPLNTDCYDLHSCYTTTCKEDFDKVDTIPWIPIDPNVILFKHENNERIPSTLNPNGCVVTEAGRLKLANNQWLVKRKVRANRKNRVPKEVSTTIKKHKRPSKRNGWKYFNKKAQCKKTS